MNRCGRTRRNALPVAAILVLSTVFLGAFITTFNQSHIPTDEPELRVAIAAVDARPDLSINATDIYIVKDGDNVSSATFGHLVSIHGIVYNLGASNVTDVSIRLGIRGVSNAVLNYNYTIVHLSYNISCEYPDNLIAINYTWIVSILEGGLQYEIWVLLDPSNWIDEQNETNNFSTCSLTIDPLSVSIDISTDEEEYFVGDLLVYSAVITYYGTDDRVPYVPGIEFYVVDLAHNQEVPNTRTLEQTSSAQGTIVGTILLPTDLDSGRYQVLAEFRGSMYSGNTPVAFEVIGPSEPLSMTALASIVAAVVAAIVVVAVFLLKRRQAD